MSLDKILTDPFFLDLAIHTSRNHKSFEYHAHLVMRDLQVLNIQAESWDDLINELIIQFQRYKNKDKN